MQSAGELAMFCRPVVTALTAPRDQYAARNAAETVIDSVDDYLARSCPPSRPLPPVRSAWPRPTARFSPRRSGRAVRCPASTTLAMTLRSAAHDVASATPGAPVTCQSTPRSQRETSACGG